ncbi:hypothetical protein NQ317_012724 [Molorchus minor]|uniref:Uncharacterized protein n=1 Tax=Molorchus minor TaxID=1323400 RepID=A0ABQ9JNV1_9CUCU|nr:hypothetical protein NQ317_012724 [Molorchus minor]
MARMLRVLVFFLLVLNTGVLSQETETAKSEDVVEVVGATTDNVDPLPVAPQSQSPKPPAAGLKLSPQQIDKLANKVLQAYGVEPSADSLQDLAKVEKLRKVVNKIESDLEQKLKETAEQPGDGDVTKSGITIQEENIQDNLSGPESTDTPSIGEIDALINKELEVEGGQENEKEEQVNNANNGKVNNENDEQEINTAKSKPETDRDIKEEDNETEPIQVLELKESEGNNTDSQVLEDGLQDTADNVEDKASVTNDQVEEKRVYRRKKRQVNMMRQMEQMKSTRKIGEEDITEDTDEENETKQLEDDGSINEDEEEIADEYQNDEDESIEIAPTPVIEATEDEEVDQSTPSDNEDEETDTDLGTCKAEEGDCNENLYVENSLHKKEQESKAESGFFGKVLKFVNDRF